MRKVEARDEVCAQFAAGQLPVLRMGAALLVDDSIAALAEYLSHGAAAEPTEFDREAYNAR